MRRSEKRNYIHPSATIGDNVQLGNGNYIGPGCIIGFPAEHKGKWNPAEHGSVIIGDNNVFTGLVTVDGGMERDTVIMNNCFLMKHSHVGHDAIIHDDVIISCGAKVGGHAIIHKGSNLGLNACIHQRQEVREGCMIGMGTIITKRTVTEPNTKYAGVPAKKIGINP